MTTIDITAIMTEVRATTPHGLCPYCSQPGPVEARDPEPPHYAPHAECEVQELRAHYAFMAAEQRISAPGCLTVDGEPTWAFASWGPDTLVTYAHYAFEAIKGEVMVSRPAYLRDLEVWTEPRKPRRGKP